MSYSTEDSQQIERLIRISREKPLDSDTFVPWETALGPEFGYLPEKLVSLAEHPIYPHLTYEQKRELAKREVAQAMYAYCWSEGLFCAFMTRYIMPQAPDHLERRFLLHEVIEESKHQQMFANTIAKMGVQPVPVTPFQAWVGEFCVRYCSPSFVFMSCIAIEMMADRYGEALRHDKNAHPILQKVAQLHNIEEARHILFTKLLLKRYTENIGFWRSTQFSLIVLLNMRFFQSTYIHSSIYDDIGLPHAAQLRREAFRSYQERFAKECLCTVRELVDSFNGFNFITRPLWRRILRMPV